MRSRYWALAFGVAFGAFFAASVPEPIEGVSPSSSYDVLHTSDWHLVWLVGWRARRLRAGLANPKRSFCAQSLKGHGNQ